MVPGNDTPFRQERVQVGFAMVHRVVATAVSLVAAACVAAVVIVAASGRTGTEAPLAAAVVSQEETARRLETAGLGGIFRRRSRFNIRARLSLAGGPWPPLVAAGASGALANLEARAAPWRHRWLTHTAPREA